MIEFNSLGLRYAHYDDYSGLAYKSDTFQVLGSGSVDYYTRHGLNQTGPIVDTVEISAESIELLNYEREFTNELNQLRLSNQI
jgi:hypothetical protein